MDAIVPVLGVAMRWLHVSSAIIAIGSVFYARYIMLPALAKLPAATREELGSQVTARFRSWAYAAIVVSLGSGFYNFFTKAAYPPGYHMWFGIKFLFALHVFAVLFLLAKGAGNDAKKVRWMTGIIVSGAITVLISSYLRWITLAAR
jgi:uncharacterized membrane protein